MQRPLHILAFNRTIDDVDDDVLRSFAYVDGAVVVDAAGRILSFGAILRIPPEAPRALRAAEGARSAIAQATSHYGPVLKVSEDGLIAMFDGGEQLWEM